CHLVILSPCHPVLSQPIRYAVAQSPAHREGLDGEGELAPGAEADAAAEDVVVAALDGIEQTTVGARHDLEDGPSRSGQIACPRPGGVVVITRPPHLETHQLAEALVVFAALQLLARVAVPLQVLARQVAAATLGVFTQVAQDVGELKGNAGALR